MNTRTRGGVRMTLSLCALLSSGAVRAKARSEAPASPTTAAGRAILPRVPSTASAPPAHCAFHEANTLAQLWEGGCGPLFDQTPRMKLKPARGVASGRWRADISPSAVWAGTMSDSGYADAALELELYKGQTGIFRTAYGWYAVRSFADTRDSLTFALDTSAEVPPSPLDVEIIRRADLVLSSNAVWNRADDRRCPARATTWSIYCALDRAAVAATCGTHHRRPAMEAVRVIVDERAANRNYHHHLMDYNNDSTTTLADVHSLFHEALARVHRSADQPLADPAVCPPPPGPIVTAADTMIVSRMERLLSSEDAWNKHDADSLDTCPAAMRGVTLRCALKRASLEMTGEYDGGDGAVVSEARRTIDALPHRQYDARLIDFNNDPAMSFDDLRRYLELLKSRLAAEIGR